MPNLLSIQTAPNSGSGLKYARCLQLTIRNEGAGSTHVKINSNSARLVIEPGEHVEIFKDTSGTGVDVTIQFQHDLPTHNVQVITLQKPC